MQESGGITNFESTLTTFLIITCSSDNTKHCWAKIYQVYSDQTNGHILSKKK